MGINEYLKLLKFDSISVDEYNNMISKFGKDSVDSYFDMVLSNKEDVSIFKKVCKIINFLDEFDEDDVFESDTKLSNYFSVYINQLYRFPLLTMEEEKKYGRMLLDNRDVYNMPDTDDYSVLINKNRIINLKKIFASIKNKNEQTKFLDLLASYYNEAFWNYNSDDKFIKKCIDKYKNLIKKLDRLPTINDLNNYFKDEDFRSVYGRFSDDDCVCDSEILCENLRKYFIYMLARNKFICHNLRLAFNLAKKYNMGYDLSDTVENANIGLMLAVDRYDCSYDARFSSYACWWIKQSIFKSRMDRENTIRVPVYLNESIRRINSFIRRYFNMNGVMPSVSCISEKLDIPIELVEKSLNTKHIYFNLTSLNSFIDDENNIELIDMISCDEHGVEGTVIHHNLRKSLFNLLSELTDRERDILIMRYGFENGMPMTLEEIGKKYNLTKERIRQIESKALDKLRIKGKTKKLKIFLENI